MPKRAAERPAAKPAAKKEKKMPPMPKTSHKSDSPGWCSEPSKALSQERIAQLDAGDYGQVYNAEFWEDTCDIVETRTLVQCPPCDDDNRHDEFWIVEDAQRLKDKYGYAVLGKGLERMKDALDQAFDMSPYNYTVLVLLGKDQPICRSNCIPGLAEAGIVIQRRSE